MHQRWKGCWALGALWNGSVQSTPAPWLVIQVHKISTYISRYLRQCWDPWITGPTAGIRRTDLNAASQGSFIHDCCRPQPAFVLHLLPLLDAVGRPAQTFRPHPFSTASVFQQCREINHQFPSLPNHVSSGARLFFFYPCCATPVFCWLRPLFAIDRPVGQPTAHLHRPKNGSGLLTACLQRHTTTLLLSHLALGALSPSHLRPWASAVLLAAEVFIYLLLCLCSLAPANRWLDNQWNPAMSCTKMSSPRTSVRLLPTCSTSLKMSAVPAILVLSVSLDLSADIRHSATRSISSRASRSVR